MGEGFCASLGEGAGFPSNNVARDEAYMHATFYLDPSNRLATVHQRYRQDRTGQDSVPTDRTTVP